MNRIKSIYEFRPDKLYTGALLRYNEGNWIDDDGEYDIAFVTKNDNFALMVDMPYCSNLLWSWCKNMNWRANIPNHPRLNPWHYMTNDHEPPSHDGWKRDIHPNTIAGDKAMNFVCNNHGCANGEHVEFNVLDKTINAGLLRTKNTKEIVIVPEIFDCVYCGEHNWRKKENE